MSSTAQMMIHQPPIKCASNTIGVADLYSPRSAQLHFWIMMSFKEQFARLTRIFLDAISSRHSLGTQNLRSQPFLPFQMRTQFRFGMEMCDLSLPLSISNRLWGRT